MNYYVLRITIILVVGLIIFLINKFILKKNLKDIRFISVTGVFILAVVVLPYDKVFLKFNSIEKLFDYYYPNVELLKKYEYEDYAYALYQQDDTYNFIHLNKEDNHWKYENSILKQSIIKVEDGFIFATNEIEEKEVLGVLVFSLDEEIEINDSLGTKFNKNEYDNAFYYVGIINKKYNDNYEITINGKEYQVLK